MTEKLYYTTPFMTSCEATVLSCEKTAEGCIVTLDRSIIFPEGGGQPADHGTIDGIRILDAHEKDGVIYHTCAAPVEVGSRCRVELDIARRLDHSEQHTGEHILSGVAHNLCGAQNVGFHMAADYCTIDLDMFLDEDALSNLEAEANIAVRRNLPVTAEHMNHERLAQINLRKKSDIKSDDIRVVFIGGGEIDSCTCCGTHCASTGEVGYIRISDSQKYKGGTRIWFACGSRAVNAANELTRSVTAMARSYSTSREELPAAVRKQSDELNSAKRDLKARTQALCDLIAANDARKIAITTIDGFGANDVKMLSESLVSHNARVALVFGIRDEHTYYRALRADGESAPMNELVKAVNALVNGKGGGSPAFAQGSAASRITPEIIGSLENFVEKWYQGNN
ncbi:MAG: hypothetical protein IKH21_07345 [Clostridia bacterium]|nr:hypothetical protein [Clostridia bacterium]